MSEALSLVYGTLDVFSGKKKSLEEKGDMKRRVEYVVQADYENGETLFFTGNGTIPSINIDDAWVFLSEQAAEKVAEEKNSFVPDLVWEVAEL